MLKRFVILTLNLLFLFFIVSSAIAQETPEDLNNKGLESYDKGKYDDAISYFDKALLQDPNAYPIWNNKGLALYKKEKYDDAINCFNKAVGIKADYTKGWYNKGYTLLTVKKYEEAIVCFNQVLKYDKNYPNINTKLNEAKKALDTEKQVNDLINKGIALEGQGKYDEAISCFDKALTLDPKNVTAQAKKDETEKARSGQNKPNVNKIFEKGEELFNQKKYKEAIDCYDKALASDPDFVPALLKKGVALAITENLKEAEKYISKALEINPNIPEAWTLKGDILVKQEKFDEALKCINKALELKPGDPDLVTKKHGLEEILAGHPNTGPSPEAIKLYEKGEGLLNQKKYKEAIDCYDKLLAGDPNCFPALFKKGTALFSMDKPEEACICVNKAIELNPAAPEVWVLKGDILAKEGKCEEALKCYDKVLELMPANHDAQVMIQAKKQEIEKKLSGQKTPAPGQQTKENEKYWFDKGQALLKQLQYEKALECFDKALAINPDYIPALIGKGSSMIMFGKDRKDGVVYLRQAVKLDPEFKQIDLSSYDLTPLHILAICDDKKMAETFINKGADVNAKDKDGSTPLHATAVGDSVDVAELLISKGVDINIKNNNGATPLHAAVFFDSKEILNLLISRGADVNAAKNDGGTPLHMAAAFNRKDIAKLLISAGANINARDKSGKTPLVVATNPEMKLFLRKNGGQN